MIKLGGEWISLIDIENVVIVYLGVVEVVCIVCVYLKWIEWLLFVVVLCEGVNLICDMLFVFYEGKVVKWWILDDVVFVELLLYIVIGKL